MYENLSLFIPSAVIILTAVSCLLSNFILPFSQNTSIRWSKPGVCLLEFII